MIKLKIFFFSPFETGLLCVGLAILELTLLTRLALRFTLPLPPRAWIQGVDHHHWVYFCFLFVNMQVRGSWRVSVEVREPLLKVGSFCRCGGVVSHFQASSPMCFWMTLLPFSTVHVPTRMLGS